MPRGSGRNYPPAVDQDGAGAALAVIAALLGTGQTELFTQRIEQRGAWIEREIVPGAVYREADIDVHFAGFGSGRLGRGRGCHAERRRGRRRHRTGGAG